MKPEVLRNPWLTTRSASLVAGISTLGVYLTLGNSKAPFLLITLVALIVGSYTLGLLLLTTLPILRTRITRRYLLLVFIVLLVIIGASRGWLMFELIRTLVPEFENSLSIRIINSSLTLLIWGLIFFQLETRLQVFRDSYRRKFSERAADLAARSQLSPSEIAASIDSLDSIRSLQANLKQISQTTEPSKVSNSQLIAASQKIRDAVETSLRPLSHRIWFESSEAQPKFKLIEVLKEALVKLQINWYPTSLIISACFFFGALSLYDLLPLATRIFVFGVTLAILLKILEIFGKHFSGSLVKGALILLTISFVSNFSGEVISSLIFFGQLFSNEPLLSIAGLISTAGILWVESVFSQLRRDWDIVNTAIDDSGHLFGATILQSKFAGYLHNNLQSRLNGIALALERVGTNDKSQVDEILERLRTIGHSSIGQDFMTGKHDPISAIHQIAVSWRGIAEVRLSIPESLQGDPRLEIVAELIQEAVSNAVRHSGASVIEISVNAEVDCLRVEIAHASNKDKSSKGSLGQMWLEHYSQNHRVVLGPDGLRRLTVVI